MPLEIERRFLTAAEAWRGEARSSTRITQGYLSRDPDRTVRVRVAGAAVL